MYIVIYSFLSYITYTYLMDRIWILSSFVGLESRYSLFLVLRISCILRTITNSYLLALALTLVCIYNIFAPLLLSASRSGKLLYYLSDAYRIIPPTTWDMMRWRMTTGVSSNRRLVTSSMKIQIGSVCRSQMAIVLSDHYLH